MTEPSSSTLPRFQWRHLLWMPLILYWLLLAFLVYASLAQDSQQLTVCLALAFVGQFVFIFGAGGGPVLKPVQKGLFIAPLIATVFMFGALGLATFMALGELCEVKEDVVLALLLGAPLVVWSLWGVLFWIQSAPEGRYRTLKRLTGFIFTGSLLQLLAAIPAHLIANRRPRCLAGLVALLGVVGGVAVAFWCFGPGLFLLILRGSVKAEEAAGRKGVHPPKLLRFSLGGLVVFTLFLASLMPLLIVRIHEEPERAQFHSSFLHSPFFWLAVVFEAIWLTLVVRRLRAWERELWEQHLRAEETK